MSTADPSADAILTVDQLSSWSFDGTALAVLGHPIKHSLSPAMHNAALTAMARTATDYLRWGYFRFDVPPEQLSEALPRLHAAGFHGLNLTMPHKVLAFDLIQEIDPTAAAIGAVNTLRRTAGGWRGYNTDGHGLSQALKERLGLGLPGANVVLLGAGGAARGAAIECLQQHCAGLWIGNRTATTRDALVNELQRFAGKAKVQGFDPAHPPADLPGQAIVINATSLGLKPEDPAPMDLRRLPPGARVYDMVYNPPQTALLRDAATLGLPCASGLSMLVHQGARSLEIWTGATVPVAVMQTAATTALGPRPLPA